MPEVWTNTVGWFNLYLQNQTECPYRYFWPGQYEGMFRIVCFLSLLE